MTDLKIWLEGFNGGLESRITSERSLPYIYSSKFAFLLASSSPRGMGSISTRHQTVNDLIIACSLVLPRYGPTAPWITHQGYDERFSPDNAAKELYRTAPV